LGKDTLNEDNLAPILESFKNDLMAKNVAEEIARNIVNSLQTKLLNQKTQMFSSISGLVKQSLKETLTNILTPKRKIDILSEAALSREKGEPYIITFIGVNGVGKSTNLAKIAYLFKNQVSLYLFINIEIF
jgi:signal recognition particle receptor subunit alpha